FLKRGARVADLRRAAPVELGDFFDGPYAADLLSSPASFMRAGVVLRRSGLAAGRAVTLEKSLSAEAERPRIEVVYRLGDAGSGPLDMLFAVELNLALIETKGRLEITEESGPGRTVALSDETESAPATRVVVVEGHTGFEISFFIEPAAAVWHYPVRTVSRTEKGFEANYQGSALLFVWGGSGRMPDEMRLVIEAGEGRPDAVP
ncbi:MAG TPA: alpha-amylase/4-alpha-glucanotransferase domain-containing protein, partial [Candidatus Polarisedimenticolia bacterium]|nr:alpha-amylase/4-alpha-glucanotransferase domain-containing protein [Candidatus Polarisedimenticolia bacterium]